MMSRVDWHILPFVTILYLLAFLDRVNIANARTFNLESDLGLKKTQYNTGKNRMELTFAAGSTAGLRRFDFSADSPVC